jgi:hypothetical protein
LELRSKELEIKIEETQGWLTIESPLRSGPGRGGLRRDPREEEEIKIARRDGPLEAGRSTPIFDESESK